MKTDKLAFGKPGIPPTWASSKKDMVITGLGSSRVWATLGHGVLNEVYWPSTGRPQIRDLGFIVARGDRWWELKRLGNYEISTPAPHVLLPSVRHTGEGFSVLLDILCDDLRDVVRIRYRLQGDGCRLYALLAPRLGSTGHNNTAWCERGRFLATGGNDCLALHAAAKFDKLSAGYVGYSDGWTDFRENNRMCWQHERAEHGNVAVMGRLAENEGEIALALAESCVGADTLARSSLADGFECIERRVIDRWIKWDEDWSPPADVQEPLRSQIEHCVAVLKTCEERLYPGAVVASLSTPWGNSGNGLGGYHLVWARDSVESALAMIAVGHYTQARQLVSYLIATQQPDGHWLQNFYPSGEPFWTGIQLDETSFPVLLAAKLKEIGELGELKGVAAMIHSALGFLLRAGPVSPQDRWEECEGLSVFSIALIVAAVVAGSEFLEDEAERAYILSYADYLNHRIEDWLYAEGTELAEKYNVDGHYLRLARTERLAGDYGQLHLRNGQGSWPAPSIVALDYMYLARLGLRRADETRMQNTLKVVEGELRKETPSGPSYYRYSHDGYGEHDDGAPFDGVGRGRLWPLLTGERGHLAVLLGEDARPYLEAMRNMAGPGGLIPEQVWDQDPIPEQHLFPGKPSGSAMPLLWAHAELVKLATASVTGAPIELLDAVRRRYDARRPPAPTWHWRTYAPFNQMPRDADLLVEAPEPFTLHFGRDDWRQIEDRRAAPLGFGMHGVRLTDEDWRGAESISLTLHYSDDRWAEQDYRIRLTPPGNEQALAEGAHAHA